MFTWETWLLKLITGQLDLLMGVYKQVPALAFNYITYLKKWDVIFPISDK